jgi:hypothetical protein
MGKLLSWSVESDKNATTHDDDLGMASTRECYTETAAVRCKTRGVRPSEVNEDDVRCETLRAINRANHDPAALGKRQNANAEHGVECCLIEVGLGFVHWNDENRSLAQSLVLDGATSHRANVVDVGVVDGGGSQLLTLGTL